MDAQAMNLGNELQGKQRKNHSTKPRRKGKETRETHRIKSKHTKKVK